MHALQGRAGGPGLRASCTRTRAHAIAAPPAASCAARAATWSPAHRRRADARAGGGRASRPGSRAARSRPTRSGARCSARTSRSSSSPTSWPSASSSTTVAHCYRGAGRRARALSASCPAASRTTSRTPKPNGYRSLHTGVIGPEQRSASRCRSAPARCTRSPSTASPRTGATSRATASRPTARQLPLGARAARHPGARRRPGGVPRAHQARAVPGPGVLLHAEGRPDRAAARRDAGRLRLRGALARSATPASAPRSTAASCRCARALENGDQVEIITLEAQTPSPAWEALRRHRQGAARIRRFVRPQAARAVRRARPQMLAKAFRQERLRPLREGAGRRAEEAEAGHRRGSGTPPSARACSRRARCWPRSTPAPARSWSRRRRRACCGAPAARSRPAAPRTPTATRVPIRGLIPGMAVHFAGCCHPLPGDRIVGIVTTGKGVTDPHHRLRDARSSFQDTPERWVDVAWESEGEAQQLHRPAACHRGQRAGRAGRAVHRDRQDRRQHLEPEDHQPDARLLRDADRRRGARRAST